MKKKVEPSIPHEVGLAKRLQNPKFAAEDYRIQFFRHKWALAKIDWHLRTMQTKKVISMRQMIKALKVISDALYGDRS